MAKGIFVTGTDTGVGKTYVSFLLLRWLRASGVSAGVMKPVETGCFPGHGPRGAEGPEHVGTGYGTEHTAAAKPVEARRAAGVEELVPVDALKLVEAAGSSDDMSLVAPFRFSGALAPMVAASAEGMVIDPQEILRCYREISSLRSFTVVEGAGGLAVPITPQYSMIDLASDVGLPVLVVAASKLGVINHSLLTMAAARNRGLNVAALVLNNLDSGTDEARRTNAATLRELVTEPVVELSFGATMEDIAEIGELLGC